ncbi:TRAP transporter small permease subunit [Dongia rigui]|uniref:TRAP transporter small permease protein n=1 Tax=Dongia rigui TaxID=940149 RepID=A0ABU5E0I6_9PROT|nr:TRAP transporter small permease subunit [Dongia rigui]MDY0873045.1 TRAP transporter small permease subunit [Dongia rigui]
MHALLIFSRVIDRLNTGLGKVAAWAVLLACLISAGNATFRYLFSNSSNALLEIQWYLFSASFLLGAALTLKLNEHVRVDIVYMSVGERGRLWIDIIGFTVFMLPATIILTYMSWDFFLQSWGQNETSANAGGLVRWPVKLLMPFGFGMLSLQGISELIKRIATLVGVIHIDTHYERPLQ